MLLVVLLAVNYWAASRVTHENPRVRVPYSPFFIAQVNAGDVKQINSRGTAIQGTFRRKLRYPPTDKKAKLTDRFKTEVPAFANTDQLSALLQRKSVVVNAEPPDQGPSLLGQLLLGFGPTILLVALFVWFARRAAQQGGGLMSFGRSRARRSEGGEQRVTFDDVAGIDDAKAELTEVVDFLRDPQQVPAAWADACRAACCWRDRPAPARRSSPARWRERPACRSSACRPRSSWR